jgi:serine/threonine-protein kinase
MIQWKEVREALLPADRKSLLPPNLRLPILPVAVTKFAQRADDPNVELRELSKIIETDSGLTTELLKYANSSAVSLRKKASTPLSAITLLGIRNTKLYLLTTAVKRAMRGTESKLINLPSFWMTNLERAILAQNVARLLKADADLAFAAGMLQDFLLPIVTNEMYPHYARFAERQPTRPVHLVDFEMQTFQWTHAEAAACIMHAWGFPDDLICCTALHHSGLQLLADPTLGRSAAAAVAVSAMIPCPLRQVPDGIEQLIRLEQAWPAFRLEEIASTVDAEFQSMAMGSTNHFSFKRAVEKAMAGAAV